MNKFSLKVKHFIIPVIVLIAIVSVIADFYATQNMQTFLTMWSYLGWSFIFFVLYVMLQNLWYAFGTIFLIAVVQDAGLVWMCSIASGTSFYPINRTPAMVQGIYFCFGFLGQSWFGLPSMYYIFPILGIGLILLGKKCSIFKR